MLCDIDLDALAEELRTELKELSERETRRDSEGQKRQRIIKRLEVVEAFRTSGNKPEWMILDVGAGHSAGVAPHGAAGRRPLSPPRT